MFLRTLTIAAATALTSASAFGQTATVNVPYGQPATTAGFADAIRATGEAYANIASGRIDVEVARRAYIENTKHWHAASVEHQQLIEERRKEANAARRASRDRRDAMAAHQGVERISGRHYDRATGIVKWPQALLSIDFAEERRDLEELLEERAYSGDPRDDILVYYAASDLLEKLKTKVRDVPSFTYMDARKFLTLMASEARQDATQSPDMIAVIKPDADRKLAAR
jgi:hypothetical protein